ncbi:ATP-binding protein [Muriicola sp. SD30]|uniref:tetratricopeptide repeat-containing hybrid sensor histidine kinase/response regulator n=1 Tax=Muriicola sp. SD30 TaxID=3240936 RepID=UPI00350FF5F3
MIDLRPYKRRLGFLVLFVLATFLMPIWSQDNASVEATLSEYFEEYTAYKNQDQLDMAFDVLDKAQQFAESSLNEKGMIGTYNRFALLNLLRGDREKAEFYLARANRMLESYLSYPSGEGFSKFVEAKLLFSSDLNFRALQELIDAKKLSNDRNLLNNMVLLEGMIYMRIQDYEKASISFNALLVNTDPIEKNFLTTKAHLGLAQLYLQTEDFKESIKNSINALELAQRNNFKTEFLQANEYLAQAYEKDAQYKLALQYKENIVKIKDSIFTIDKLKAETNKADKLAMEDAKAVITRQDERIEELSESANRSEITAILTSAFLTIISLLAVSLYRNNQIKLKTNDLLQTKNRELQAARDAAVQAMEAKTNFLSTVSHELRTPLYAVTGLTHLLLEENPPDHQKEHLKSLKFSGDYLLNFINDILQINKIDADKLEPASIEFYLKKIISEVIDSLQQSAKEKNTKIILEYDDNIPQHLMSDPLKLSQILINLIGNSIKFTKNGEVRVIVKLLKKEEENVTVYFEVRDNGIGISKEQQQSIFDSFEQGSIQINREYGGTGLGLTIVKSLLGLFDSQIELKSEIGKGSSFFFELELKAKDSVVDDVPFELEQKEYDLNGLHVLVVEDNKINQVITKKMLAKRGIGCDIAENGMEAIDKANKNQYDGILMDIHMPGISGVEATIEIRKFDRQTSIIALTAISLDDSLESFYAAGCNDVVTKPFKPEVFYQKIGENFVDAKQKKSAS